MGEIRMPSLGADMESGRLAEWLVAPGDRIARGDVIAVVETQKGAIEIEAFEGGTVGRLEVAEGQTVPVGAPILSLEEPAAAAAAAAPPPSGAPAPTPEPAPAPAPERVSQPTAAPPAPEGVPQPAVPSPAPAAVEAAPPSRAAERVRASPAARRLAQRFGMDLAALTGSGPEDAVVSADVRRAREAERQAPTPERRAPEAGRARGLDLAEMRKAIAAAMARSKREIPHFYVATQVDLKAAADWLAETNAARPPDERMLMGALFLKATAKALLEHSVFNGTFEDGSARPGDGVHIGTAVAIRGGGLIAPAIHDCDRLSLDALMARMRDLVARVRGGGLRSSELTDPTVTVSSLGDRGVETLFGIIYPPQVALIGFGRVTETVLAVEGAPVVRPAVSISLAADHRVADGHRGGLFLRTLASLLQEPQSL